MGDFVVLGGINFSRIQAGQQRLVRFRGLYFLLTIYPLSNNELSFKSWTISYDYQ